MCSSRWSFPRHVIWVVSLWSNSNIAMVRICEMYIVHRNPKNTRNTDDFLGSGTKLVLPSWLLGFSTWGERDTIFTMLTVPFDPTTRSAPPRPNWTRLGSDLNLLLFSKYPRITAHHFQACHHSHPQFHFLFGVFIMTSVIVTSSPCEREHLRSMCSATHALSRNGLSLTKPKDKI